MARWSFGAFGDMLWDTIPELRPAVRRFVCEKLEMCIAIDEAMDQPHISDFTRSVIGPHVLDLIEQGREDPDILRKFAQLLRNALSYVGPELKFHEDLDLFLLENMDTSFIVPAMSRVDPELVELIRQRFGRWR